MEESKKDIVEVKENKSVVSGNVKVKKKTAIEKVKKSIFAESFENVKSFMINDVILPETKKLIGNSIIEATRMMFGLGRSYNSNSREPDRVSYRSYYENDRFSSNRSRNISSRRTYEFNDIIFDNREDADNVIDKLYDMLATYHKISVADYYDIVGVQGDYTANSYGWSNLGGVRVVRVPDGWIIDFPPAYPI